MLKLVADLSTIGLWSVPARSETSSWSIADRPTTGHRSSVNEVVERLSTIHRPIVNQPRLVYITPIHFPMNPEKTFIPYIYNASSKDPY